MVRYRVIISQAAMGERLQGTDLCAEDFDQILKRLEADLIRLAQTDLV